jgi:hypothetical protein
MSLGVIALVIVLTGFSCMLIARAVDRPLDASSDAALRTSYFRKFFIQVGLGEVPFFLGIAAIALTGHFWLYFVGAAFSVVVYIRFAPTARNIDRIQRKIDLTGSQCSLRQALETLPSRSRRSGWK